MARFEVFQNPGRDRERVPFLLDIQSNHLLAMDTRLVAPLRLRADFPPTIAFPEDLFPLINIHGKICFMETTKMAAIPHTLLRNRVTSIAGQQAEIMMALDRVFGGY